jgi:hypothetical protein
MNLKCVVNRDNVIKGILFLFQFSRFFFFFFFFFHSFLEVSLGGGEGPFYDLFMVGSCPDIYGRSGVKD